jgi:hypothetical protein
MYTDSQVLSGGYVWSVMGRQVLKTLNKKLNLKKCRKNFGKFWREKMSTQGKK